MPSFFFHLTFDFTSKLSLNKSSKWPSEESRIADPRSSVDSSLTIDEIPEHSHTGFSSKDWRYDRILQRTISMTSNVITEEQGKHSKGLTGNPRSSATKGRYEPIESTEAELGLGVVRLYRDAEATPDLYDEPVSSKQTKTPDVSSKTDAKTTSRFQDEDCTTLCILAVPSYLTPSDFLGFVGEKTREEVSHFRMVRTERSNRYMVLMKFRSGRRAREWRKEWNGKHFDGMEPEYCHVVFVKSIEFKTYEQPGQENSFPDMRNDPFTPSVVQSPTAAIAVQTKAPRSTKPMAPPTPALIELPTCPVCLERMDESTGLFTILCQHVFHCSCLQKWQGSGCPVCRYTQDDVSASKCTTLRAYDQPVSNECRVCHAEENLWICLICGHVGCGRYDLAHAFTHFEQTGHCFAMDMTTQRVWDYATDGYVHRILQDKSGGKFVELEPSAPADASSTAFDHDYDGLVPREKIDNITLEYTSLLTSQLESQRTYFEEILARTADKASSAAAAADRANETCAALSEQLSTLQASHDTLLQSTLPSLEKDRDRERSRAEASTTLARKMEREWRDEKAMNGSLLERVKLLGTEVDELKGKNTELNDQNRDLMMFVEGREKLAQMEGVEQAELQGGTVEVAEKEEKGKRKKRGVKK
ncbi:uncharacterized protein KY384_004273 [Bacidia gigantensis]|uniref:uncharacterized protein n=1 Tax=Bacidia gigantensis TaxID=2732470 RepID=UPI001D057C3E|nr:uncharacterized protein KY384_004273 [Bacidia gigantensis]KAG8530916.1 hypothetical protein KY384_004273 [Bacidia gigantensis]